MRKMKWWPTWYVTRLHAVPANPPGALVALCGQWTSDPMRLGKSEWQRKRMEGEVPKCKHCLRQLDGAA